MTKSKESEITETNYHFYMLLDTKKPEDLATIVKPLI